MCEDEPHVIGDATSESIQARHYCGQPITSFDADGPVAQRPHTRAERCLLSSASERSCLRLLLHMSEVMAKQHLAMLAQRRP